MLPRLNRLRTSLLPTFFSTSKVDFKVSSFRSTMSTSSAQPEIATFAAGCFWGVEHMFLKHYPPEQNKGILKTSVGYTGGIQPDDKSVPTYGEVCEGDTAHAEAVKIEFDPEVVGYEELVEFFFRIHDPTTLNQQGNDRGTQYRSAIFVHSPEQREQAESVRAAVSKAHLQDYEKKRRGLRQKGLVSRGKEGEDGKIVTDIADAEKWYDAEEYHQLYLFKNPHGYECPAHTLYW